MTTGTIVTIATVSLITMATLVALCPRTRRKGLVREHFLTQFFITVAQVFVKGYSQQIDHFMPWTVKVQTVAVYGGQRQFCALYFYGLLESIGQTEGKEMDRRKDFTFLY